MTPENMPKPKLSAGGGGASTSPLNFFEALTFARWKQLYFSPEELGDPAISGDLADPDFDGLRNLMEYGLNLDPRTASTTGLPYFTLDSTYFSLVYPKLLAATDLTYTIEKSTDLVLWLTVTPVDQILMDDGYMRTVKAQVLRTEAGTAGQLFLRLRVTR